MDHVQNSVQSHPVGFDQVLGGFESACMLSARSVMTRDIGGKCVATS
jgi:hypothetical protein